MSIQFGLEDISYYSIQSIHEASVRLYFNSEIQIQQSILSYSILSLLAEVGGYIGLLLGVSFLDMANILERLLFKK
jgi:hypothetical protein